jgi:hypothetical protein
LCHQSSNGADVSIAPQPSIATHAPSGARNPQNQTALALACSDPPNVVRSATIPELTPASNPPPWMSMCAGVQNVSRPMDMCHEMSQIIPVTIIVAAATTAYACQANTSARSAESEGA